MGRPSAHPNSRFTSPAGQCPVIDPAWENPEGVPISAMIFGGRRGSVVPLVCQSLDWNHGTFYGGKVSLRKPRPQQRVKWVSCATILLRCFPSVAIIWPIILGIGLKLETARCQTSQNFFSKLVSQREDGSFLWPGFWENARVLKWIFERTEEVANAKESPIGLLPSEHALDLSGLKLTKETLNKLTSRRSKRVEG